ncbi:MAG: Flp pilus assembly protein CpaB [Deltaproteobacteria bacterium]|nr:Flp pilus assembly protein CpaB [Deltaproteobacteria bacterium]
MRGKAPLIFLLVAVLLAGGAAWGAQQWIRLRAAQVAAKRINLVPVMVAGADMPAGTELAPNNLSFQKWPKDALPPGTFSSAPELEKRVLKVPVFRGEPILANKLAAMGLAGGLSAVVPDGFRAMTLKVDEVIGVAGFVQAGDQVDVLLTFQSGEYRDDPVTRTILQSVPVLTVGEKVIGEDPKSKGAKRVKVTVVTLKLLPEQAERLALGMTSGKVILALRNQGDQTDPKRDGVRLTALLGTAKAPKPGPPPNYVEIIKGTDRAGQNL